MRKTICSTFILLTTCVSTIFAQTLKINNAHTFLTQHRYPPFLTAILRRQAAMATAAKTTQKERIVAVAGYDPVSDTLQDSASYQYSGTRGSQFDYNSSNFDYPATPYDGGTPILNYPGSIAVQSVLADTFRSWVRDSITAPLHTSEITNASYDANNNMINYFDYPDTTHNNNSRYYNTYNSSGTINSNLTFSYSSTWDSSSLRYFSYDSANRLIQDSTYTYNGSGWTLSLKYVYSYDSNGNIIQATQYNWLDITRSWSVAANYKLTYTADNKVATYYQDAIGSSPAVLDSFGYTPGYPNITYNNLQYLIGGAWTNIYIETFHLNAGSLPDSVTYVFGALIKAPTILATFHYNSFNDPDTSRELVDSAGTFIPATKNYYYYEKYNVTPANVNNFNNAIAGISLYPNPVTNQINIKLSSASVAVAYIQITDMAGRLLRTASIPMHGQTEQLSVADLDPGVYILSVHDEHGNLLGSRQIVKQ